MVNSEVTTHLKNHIAGLEDDKKRLSSENAELLARVSVLEAISAAATEDFRGKMDSLQAEIELLKSENDQLLQPHNLKQKIQYHTKIKQENNELREDLHVLREEVNKLQQTNATITRCIVDIRAHLLSRLKESDSLELRSLISALIHMTQTVAP